MNEKQSGMFRLSPFRIKHQNEWYDLMIPKETMYPLEVACLASDLLKNNHTNATVTIDIDKPNKTIYVSEIE
jgi:hypothetical protein